jgi:hypothetical protein
MNRITKAFLVVLCSILLFSCKKDESNPQTPAAKTKIDIENISGIGNPGIYFGQVPVGTSKNFGSISFGNSKTSNADLVGSVVVSGEYFSLRSGSSDFRLLPGDYIIFPTTFHPLKAGSYTVSISINHNATNMSSPITGTLSGAAY